MEKLSKLRGNEFDSEYINAMVDGHQNVVDALESRVDSTASLKDRVTNNEATENQIAPEKTDNAPKAAGERVGSEGATDCSAPLGRSEETRQPARP